MTSLASTAIDWHRPVIEFARRDVAVLCDGATVQDALATIRAHGLGERIVYFYVQDASGALCGVIPTRRLLTAPLDQRIADIMIKRVLSISQHATMLEAYELLAAHKLLALPVVDDAHHLVGIIDVQMFTGEAFDAYEQARREEIFEAIGFGVWQVRDASPLRAFRFRFPWLLATIASGVMCAMLTSVYEATLAKLLLLAFFLTLVLGLGESVSMQSMTVTIQALRATRVTLRWYLTALRRELNTAALLGAGCGSIVALVVWLWHGAALAAWVIGGSIFLVICSACLLGLSIPALLHAVRLDLKIAAGPVTLALTDLFTIVLYFSLAAILL